MFELGHVTTIDFIDSKVTCSKEILKLNMTFDKGTAKRHRRKACVNSILFSRNFEVFCQHILNKALFKYKISNVKYGENNVKTQDSGTDAGNCSGWACLLHRFLSLTSVDYNPC